MENSPKDTPAWSLWLPVTLVFLLVIAAWTYTIRLAKENPSNSIPLETIDRASQAHP